MIAVTNIYLLVAQIFSHYSRHHQLFQSVQTFTHTKETVCLKKFHGVTLSIDGSKTE